MVLSQKREIAVLLFNCDIMKRTAFVFTLCTLLGPFSLKAQVNQETDSLYLAAISYYLINRDSNHNRYPDIWPQIDTIFLEQTEAIEMVPNEINGRVIILLTGENFRKIYKQHRNRLIHTKVFPIKIKGDEIEITIIPYHGKWAKNILSTALSDWTSVYFKYDCDQKRWRFSRVVTGGI